MQAISQKMIEARAVVDSVQNRRQIWSKSRPTSKMTESQNSQFVLNAKSRKIVGARFFYALKKNFLQTFCHHIS